MSEAVCAVFQFDHPAAHQLIKLLPRLIVVDALDSPHRDWIASTLQLMAAEARELRRGGETVIMRLADILVIHAIRSWIAQDPTAQIGWLGALRDKQIGRAIASIHREPARGWSLEALASEAAMSGSAFAARFNELVGEPAMQYVTRWRMHTALMWLREDPRRLVICRGGWVTSLKRPSAEPSNDTWVSLRARPGEMAKRRCVRGHSRSLPALSAVCQASLSRMPRPGPR